MQQTAAEWLMLSGPRFVMSGCAGVDAFEEYLLTLNVGKWLVEKAATKNGHTLYVAPVVLRPYHGTDSATMVSFYNAPWQVRALEAVLPNKDCMHAELMQCGPERAWVGPLPHYTWQEADR